jgi:hypothetical protein
LGPVNRYAKRSRLSFARARCRLRDRSRTRLVWLFDRAGSTIWPKFEGESVMGIAACICWPAAFLSDLGGFDSIEFLRSNNVKVCQRFLIRPLEKRGSYPDSPLRLPPLPPCSETIELCRRRLRLLHRRRPATGDHDAANSRMIVPIQCKPATFKNTSCQALKFIGAGSIGAGVPDVACAVPSRNIHASR